MLHMCVCVREGAHVELCLPLSVHGDLHRERLQGQVSELDPPTGAAGGLLRRSVCVQTALVHSLPAPYETASMGQTLCWEPGNENE